MIDIYSASSNLGDNLSLTPLMRATPCRVHLIDDPAVRAIAPVFDWLGEVVFDNDKRLASPEVGAGPHSAKLMAAHDVRGEAIPSMVFTSDENAWGREFVRRLSFEKPVCVIKASTQQANYRTPPSDLMQQIVDLNPGVQFVMFGLSSSHVKHNFQQVKLKGVYTAWDYSIRHQAAIYHQIGRYIGPDTGDLHLMLAVGGATDVLVPPSRWDYDHNHFHYRPEDYVGEVPRTRYHDWTQPFRPSITSLNLPSNP